MKPHTTFHHLAILLVALFTMLLLNSAGAKPTAVHFASHSYVTYAADSVKAATPFTGEKSLRLNDINLHAMRNFLLRYKEVDNASWYKVEKGFVAKFASGSAVTAVTYKSTGEWLYTITGYDEKNMPDNVRKLVEDAYHNYDIVRVEQITVPSKGSTIYLAYVQDAHHVKVLRIYEGEIEAIHEYIRG